MPWKSQKKDLFSADGAHLPDHDDFSAHVDSVLEGLRSIQSKLPNRESLKRYYGQSRGLGTMVSPYMDDLTQLLEDLAKDMDNHAKAGRRYCPEGDLKALGDVMPGQFLKLVFRLWRRDKAKARKFFAMLKQGYCGGIYHTTSGYKAAAPIYVLPDPDTDVLIPRLLHHDHKFERGFNHNAFGRALVPIQYRDEYDEDPSAFRAKIKNGQVVVTEEDLPSFLFPDDIDYKADNPTNGFGTGLIFLRFLNHELVGPTSSHGEPPKGSKPSKAVSWKVEKITPRIVASVAVWRISQPRQAWIALSSMSQWGMEDGNVDLVALHENIVELLEIDDDETQDILKEINSEATPSSSKSSQALNVVPSLLAKAKELELDVIGVSFHVGSGCYDPSVYTDAILRSRKVFDMAKEAGYDFTLLDVGGGFEDGLFEQAAMYLKEAINSYFPNRQHIKIIAEPGRFYVSKAFKLAAHIIARRAPLPDPSKPAEEVKAEEDADQPKVMYYINDGVYGAFNCILFDHQVIHPYVLSMNGSFHVSASEPKGVASVWGPTCDSIDCVSPKTVLPERLQVGDWLGFDNMGAYTVCAASQFNGFEVSNVIYTSGGLGSSEVRKVLEDFAAQGHGL
ncbi:hypothetical protein NMY22_g19428 [Coprinellus aureogranulatus]|nr:hypothetical protein NMY22_g19428 [Coprinellus aureogranulatus]